MAGIEKLEVHSKSYIVRWVKVDDGYTLSWSVEPHKKSINFGIVKHPGSGATTIVTSVADDIDAPPGQSQGSADSKALRVAKREVTAQDLLIGKGFIPIRWHGKCEADKVSVGTLDLQHGQGGMYGLVFDNTFSKQTSKTATFVVLTYPTDAPPQTANNLPNLQLLRTHSSQSSLSRNGSSRYDGAPSTSVDSLHSQNARLQAALSGRTERAGLPTCHVGNLSKRRRKKGQGYARRFFSLDFSTCTLSYYYNRDSSALRGAIPLSLAAIAADERRREISIDSGAEVWHLRAPNDKEFQEWAHALERASRISRGLEEPYQPAKAGLKFDAAPLVTGREALCPEDVEWQQVEALVSRVVGTRDALRRWARDLSALSRPVAGSGHFLSPASAASIEAGKDGYFPPMQDKKPSFWRRKSSAPPLASSTLQQTAFSTMAASAAGSAASAAALNGARLERHGPRGHVQEENSIHGHCAALLSDLDSVVSEFTIVIANSKRRRMRTTCPTAGGVSRASMDTTSTADEFFDAEDAKSAVVKIDGSEDDSAYTEADEAETQDCSSISSVEDEESVGGHGGGQWWPPRPKNLAPLPMETAVSRRTSIRPATVQPPSLVAFVRKNVGKDLSTISMPVSANEPTSLLQRLAEQLEYGQLLDKASRQRSATERLLFVTAFAVSNFSSGRARERAVRKPFNPLLGETFELVRSEKDVPGGFRLLVEKVQHRPVRLAMQADSANWSYSQSPAPGQRFWGKSAEITTEGRVRVALRLADGSDECYSWNVATMFLRNVVMGEKYVEPVGTMHVVNDSLGYKASVEFKSKGMFGGRAEEVQVSTQGPDGSDTGSGLVGTWTGGLRTVGPGKAASEEVWRVGSLVDKAEQTYGMTLFAVSLNELTELEKGKLAPTDSRLRPDQRLAEQGRLEEAERWKQRLEEAQRARRREMEVRGEVYKPRWFVKAEGAPDGEEVWRMKTGKEGYWEERARGGGWAGVEAIFDVPEPAGERG